jgi:hypothetical protein
MNFDEDIVDQLDSLVASLTKGTNLFAGAVRGYQNNGAIPHKCVFVTATGGAPTRPIKVGAAGVIVQERHAAVDIRIRSDAPGVPGAFQDGQTLAREVFDSLQYNPAAGYCEFKSPGSGPNYIGEDEDSHHEWSFSIEVIYDV